MRSFFRDWFIKNFPVLKYYLDYFRLLHRRFPSPKSLGAFTNSSRIEPPVMIECPSGVFLAENASVRKGTTIINSQTEKVIIGKYSMIAANCTIITNSHRSTVSVPLSILGATHINDISKDIVIEEDVWVGAGATLLPGAHLGRGCIVGAGSVVTKPVPPYSVVAGNPAKIIAKVFELEDVILHEEALYPKEERLGRDKLEELFTEFLSNLKTYGVNTPFSEEEQQAIEKEKIACKFS